MWPNPQFPADLVIFNKEFLNYIVDFDEFDFSWDTL